MSFPLEKFTLDLIIRQERHYRDTQQWPLLRATWHPDTSQTHVSISFITGTVDDWIAQGKKIGSPTSTSAGSVTGPFHTMEPKEILVKGDRALATTLISIHMRFTYKGVVFDVESWAHQLQRFVKVDGEWKIVRFEAVYIRDSLVLPWPQAAATEEIMSGVGREIDEKKSRSCFKILAWQMGLQGFELREDLPGYDDEETWRPLVEGGRRWLEGGQ